jgi:hypothetical protein
MSQIVTSVVKAQDLIPIYEENFDDDEFNDWSFNSIDSGWCGIESDSFVAECQARFTYEKTELGESPYAFEFDLIELGMDSGFKINLQISEMGYYSVEIYRIDENKLFLRINRLLIWEDEEITLSHNEGQLFEYNPTRPYRVRFYFDNGNLNLYIIKKGQDTIGVAFLPALSAQDNQPLQPGFVAFEFFEKSFVILDNLLISQSSLTDNQPVEQSPSFIPEFPDCIDQDLLYAENFNDQQAQGWGLEGEWGVEDGMLIGNGHFFANYFEEQWEDLTLYTTFMFPYYEEGLHINIRVSEVGRYYLEFNPPFVDLKKQLGWGIGEKFIELEDFSAQISANSFHTIGFSAHRGLIEVSLDGVQQLVMLDEDYLPAGGISFETLDNRTALIDSVWVCGTKPGSAIEEPPPEPTMPTETARRPDLRISGLVIGTFDQKTHTLPLTITVINSGEIYAKSTKLQVRQLEGSAVKVSKAVNNLAPNQAREISVILTIPESMMGTSSRFEILIDPENIIIEQIENNNRQETRLIEFPALPSKPDWRIYIVPAALLVVITALIARAIHRRGKTKKEEKRKGKSFPIITPPLRLLRLWVTEGHPHKGVRIRTNQPLVTGQSYTLHAQVLSEAKKPKRKSNTATDHTTASYDFVVFSPESDYHISERNKKLNILSSGSSDEVTWSFFANQTGTRRVRVCLFYGNLLLQSAFIDAQVVNKKIRQTKRQKQETNFLTGKLDYVANATLTGFKHEPQPDITILTNQDANGKDWIAVYAGGVDVMGTTGCKPRLVNPNYVRSRANIIRDRLWRIIKESQYQVDELSPTTRTELLEKLEKDLAKLAGEGWSTFDDLFLHEVTRDMKRNYESKLRPPGLISINRCRGDKTTLPWAALYDLYVDAADLSRLKLCPIIKAQLEDHWTEDLEHYNKFADWLDNPQGCQDNPNCPLKNKDLRPYTICPFGFWGFRHQISQPHQLINSTSQEEVPSVIAHSVRDGNGTRFNQTIFLKSNNNQRIKVALGVHQEIEHADQWVAAFESLQPGSIQTFASNNRDEIKRQLEQGGFHIYLLYCHGRVDNVSKRFELDFGSRTLSWENLNPDAQWPLEPKSLVIMNACNTVSTTPEVLYRMLDGLHELGASGVIGTEIKVSPKLAYKFILAIMDSFIVEGASIGEAFLEERKALLRDYSPLGLVYSYYAPAALHLHQENNCRWCAAHGIPEDGN